MTEREELARIIDPTAFALAAEVARVMDLPALDRPPGSTMSVASEMAERQCAEALAKADQWLSRPSPVDGVVETLRRISKAQAWGEPDGRVVPAIESIRVEASAVLRAYDQARGETQ
jgi:hypothetical protein